MKTFFFKRFLITCLLGTLPATCLASTDGFSGTWSGSFDIQFADGRIGHEDAWLVLEESGKSVAGTVGPRIDQQGAIREVTLQGNQIEFVADSSQGKTLRFKLKRDGDQLSGEANGEIGADRVRVEIRTTRQVSTAALPKDQLYQKMLALDTAMFDAFNRCSDPVQLAKHAAFFDKDVEFYHDLGGVTRGVDSMIESTRKNVCGQFHRELERASFRAWPVPGFGAITTGTHRFCHSATTCEGAGEFTMVWREKDGVWQITRALSYAHREEKVAAKGAATR